jgi:iron complex outermembrane receptor protein
MFTLTPVGIWPVERALRRLSPVLFVALFLAHPAILTAQIASPGTSVKALKQLSIEELMDLEVTTVSRKKERWWSAPAGIDVVTGEDIRRSGVQNLPDALRLASGVHVAQSSARSWAISLRGMNVLAANKISVVMDGRSLYTPFFSGVLWNAQDTLLEDIDRIEVVRGPVGALWGSYAVNGFIQILTKPAIDTQGWLVSAGAGTEDPGFIAVRYGGKIGSDTAYRAYAKYFQTDWTYLPSGGHAQPATDFFQTGFRIDSERQADTTITLQGDFHTNKDLPLDDHVQTNSTGANLLGRWRRTFASDSDLQVTAYYDHTYWTIPLNFEERRDTVSLAAKYRFPVGRHDLLLGTDAFVSWDKVGNIGFAKLLPAKRTTNVFSAYVQDTITILPERTALTLGVKGEHNSFSGYEYQPSARLAWTPSLLTTIWSAMSRAIRTPVRIDHDLFIGLPGLTIVDATDQFKTEEALAYELGVRHQFNPTLTVDVSAFSYHYDNIRSTEPAGATPRPLTFKNSLNARSDGAELTVMYQPIPRLLFKGSYRYLYLEFSKDVGSGDTSNGRAEGNDPKHLATLGIRADLPANLEFDAFLRHASALPNPATPAYTALDLRLGWKPSTQWELSLSARNLLDRQHRELITTNSLNEEVHRSCMVKATWRY